MSAEQGAPTADETLGGGQKNANVSANINLPAYVDTRNGENVRRFLNDSLAVDAEIEFDAVDGDNNHIVGVAYNAVNAEVVGTADYGEASVGGVSVGHGIWQDTTLPLDWETLPMSSVRLDDLRVGNVVGVQLKHKRGSYDQRTYSYRVTGVSIDSEGYKEVTLQPCHGGSNPLQIDNHDHLGTDIYYDYYEMDVPVYERPRDPDPLAYNYSLFRVPDRQILDAVGVVLPVDLPVEE